VIKAVSYTVTAYGIEVIPKANALGSWWWSRN